MAKIKGICKNIDGCDLAADKIVQEVDSFDFKCAECGKELSPIEEKKKKKSGLPMPLIIGVAAVALLAIICFSLFSGGSPKAENLTIDKANVTFKPDQTERLNVTIEPIEVKAELVWQSSDETIVSIKDGVVTAQKPGKATVKVFVKDQENIYAFCECTVIENDVDMETLDIQEDPLILRPGGHQQLTVKFTPEDQNETISWSSSDATIATVSPRGKVDAIKVGAVLIIAKSDRTGVADTANVSVEGPAEMSEDKTSETKVPAAKPTSAPTLSPKQSAPTSNPVSKPVSKPTNASGSKNLGYATFKGSWPNDVNGRMVFSASHVIDSKDPKKRVAQPGDYVIGEWSDGHLVQGIWYGADNTVKGSVIIGK